MDMMTAFSWFSDFSDSFEKTFIREDRYKLFIDGVLLTLKVSLLAVVIGIIIGFFIALCNLSKHFPLKLFGKVYTDIIRGTPSVTQLMIHCLDSVRYKLGCLRFGDNTSGYPIDRQGAD